MKSDIEDYDEDVKGLPVRRKRGINSKKNTRSKLLPILSYSVDGNTNRLLFLDKTVLSTKSIISKFKGNTFRNNMKFMIERTVPLVYFKANENNLNGE